MFSKKTRNLTVAVLALVMALTLSFGLFGFNTTQVNAAQTDDFSISFKGSKVVYTVGGVDQKVPTTTSDGGTTLTANFKTAETFGNGAFSITASSGNMLVENNGLKFQKPDCSITFSITRAANITFGLYASSTGRGFTLSSTAEGFTSTTYKKASGDWKNSAYSFTLNNAAKGSYTLTNIAENTVYVQSISVAYTASAVTYDASTLEVTDQATEYTVVEGMEFDATKLPTKGMLYTADKAQSAEVDLTWANTEAAPLVYTASFTTPSGWNLATGFTYPTITVTTIADTRPTVTGLINETKIINAGDVLPTELTVKGYVNNDTTNQVDVNVELSNPQVDTSAGYTVTTYTATAVETQTHKVGNPAATCTLVVKERPTYTSTFSASWDITQVADGTAWNGEPTVTPITSEYTLVKAQGITINAAKGTYADSKSYTGVVYEKDGTTEYQTYNVKSALDNCVKAEGETDKGVKSDLFVVTVPAGFKGTVVVKASSYNATMKEVNNVSTATRIAKLTMNGVTVAADDKTNYRVTGDATEVKYVVDGEILRQPRKKGENGATADEKGTFGILPVTDADLMKYQFTFTFDVNNTTNAPATYNITNDTGVGKTIYASSIVVSGELPASKNYFYKGEKFDTLNIPGYTFLGWTSENAADTTLYAAEAEVPADGAYYGVAAKLEYLGVSFKKDINQPGVRFGFILKFYDLSDDPNSPNSLRTANLTTLGIDVSKLSFTITRKDGKQRTVVFDTPVSEFSDEYMGYISNLVILDVPVEFCQGTMKVDATFTIAVNGNSVERTVNGNLETINEKAEEAYNQGAFGNKGTQGAIDLAAKYGYTVA